MVGICPDLIKATQQQRHFEERGNIYTLMGLTYMNLNKYWICVLRKTFRNTDFNVITIPFDSTFQLFHF